MTEIDISRCRLPPFMHQREDTVALVGSPYLFITSEMRTGKTKIVIDAAQILFELNLIDRVLVVAPAPVRDVWFGQDLGELRKHLWMDLPAVVVEFHSRMRSWEWGPPAVRRLEWVITNYEFIRTRRHLDELRTYCTKRTLLVGDESSYLKNHDAQQTKAFADLRWLSGRVVLLNGTPISHTPLDLFSQGNILHPNILKCKYITHYKARYAKQEPVLKAGGDPVLTPKGFPVQHIVGWTNLEDLQQRFAPYVIRRLQKDCLDLPPKLDPVVLTAELTPQTWKLYKQMRDELVVWLSDNTVATAQQAAIKTLRLAQITSGFLGGVEDALDQEDADDLLPGLLESLDLGDGPGPSLTATETLLRREIRAPRVIAPTTEVGREKLDVLLWFLDQQLEADGNLHTVTWCRFRAEMLRMMDAVAQKFPQFTTGRIIGGQKKAERQEAMRLLHPETSPSGPVFVGGTYGTGSFGLNFTAAHLSINVSFDFSLGKFLQAKDRVYGPGQTKPVAYFDIVATGPKGQKTIDHHIVEARLNNENIATWTTAMWVQKLKAE